jgi:amyloid beta precursor protein binding protein 1
MTVSAEKAKRYDRGIRIWGSKGQEDLESAKVLLINAGPTGAEALKNLVLGGIHSFTVLDDAKVLPSDLGNNFFLPPDSLGSSRAQHITECLKELNDTVSGSFVEEESLSSLLSSNPTFFHQFSIILASQLREQQALQLEQICHQYNTPLVLCRSYGLVGTLRVCVSEHTVVESKPDSVVDDLRLSDPWPALSDYVDSIDLYTLDDTTHSHLPYAIILIKAAKEWKANHGGKLPSNAAERAGFKSLIISWQKRVDGVPLDEENFNEAVSNAHRVWAPPVLSAEVQALFDDAACCPEQLSSTSADFWFLVAALKMFMMHNGGNSSDTNGDGKQEGRMHPLPPPLDGHIPDMHASTQLYLDLQRLYKEKAEQDALAVEGHLKILLDAAGREAISNNIANGNNNNNNNINNNNNNTAAAIPLSEVRRFCKNARHLRLVRPRILSDEVSNCNASALRAALANEETSSSAGLYVLLRAVDKFHDTYQRYPGVYDDEVEEDLALLKTTVNATLAECGVGGAAGGSVSDDLAGEVCRCAAGELHVVAAAVGAMASQEAIKLVTGQFVPVGGTLVWNAIHCTTACFRF